MSSKIEKYLNKNFNGFSCQRWQMDYGSSSLSIHFKGEAQIGNDCIFVHYESDEYELFLSDRALCDKYYNEVTGVS